MKKGENIKDKIIRIRADEQTRQLLKDKAAELNITMSELIRRAVEDYKADK